MSYIGRGLEAGHDKPFGWYWHEERAEIRARLIAKGAVNGPRLESRIGKIQMRIHRNAPTMRERQAAWRARQPRAPVPPTFSPEMLERLAELFEGANDPITAAIGATAADMLKRLKS